MRRVRAKKRFTFLLFLCTALIISLIPMGVITATTKKATAAYTLPAITSGSLKIALKDINIVPSETGKTLSFSVSFSNNGELTLSMLDYWVRVKSKAGNQYSVKAVNPEKSKGRIAPKSSQTLTFYSSLGNNTELSDVVIQWIKFDTSVSSYEKAIGQFTFPKSFTNTVKTGKVKTIQIQDIDVKTRIVESSISETEDSSSVDLEFEYTNIGKSSLLLPALQYYLLTAEGYLYPFEVQGGSEQATALAPLKTQSTSMSVTVPAEIKIKYWKLVVVQEIGDNPKVLLPLSSYEIPKELSGGASTGSSSSFNYSNRNGKYLIEHKTVQRLPWENEDIIATDFTVSNKGTSSAAQLNFTAQYIFDGKVTIDARVVKPVNTLAIQPGQSEPVHIYAKVPYNFKYQKAELLLKESVSDTNKKSLHRFPFTPGREYVTPFHFSEELNTTEVGRSTSLSLKDVRIYEGSSSDILSVQFDITNKENRFNQPARYTAYFKSDKGEYIPARVTETPIKVNANAKNTVEYWIPVSGEIDLSKWSLIVGQGVAEDKYLSAAADVATAYIGASEFKLPEEKKATSSAIAVDFHPYTLSINEFLPYPYFSELTLTIGYELIKNSLYEGTSDGKKVVLELEDSEGNAPYSQVLDLERTEGGTALKLGKNTLVLKKNFDNIEESLVTNRPFTLNLYEEFQGQRKLLSKQSFWWYTTNRFGQQQ